MQSSETKFAGIFGKNSDLSKYSDAKLRTDDGCTFDVHSKILVGSSGYFQAMFGHMDKRRKEFAIPGISGESLSDILCYAYTGNIRVAEINATDLIIAADYLLLKDLRTKLKQDTKLFITEANCLGILQAAHQINDEDIFRECFRFIQTRFEDVMRCQKDDLANLPLEILSSILSDRSLYVYSETTVWDAIVAWTQKDLSLRLSHVPELLLTLAVEDVGEELATEILQHEIITNNPLMKDLVGIRPSNGFKRMKISHLDVLLSFLRNYSTRFTAPNSHRIPLKLHVMSSRTSLTNNTLRNNTISYLYITYDENPDLLRKITEVSSEIFEALIAVGHNIYIFSLRGVFMKFDLRTMDWVTISFPYRYRGVSFVAIDAHIYVLGKIYGDDNIGEETYNVEVYDTVNDGWFHGIPLRNISYGAAVTIGKKIYVLGGGFGGAMMQMFDPVTQQWSHLSPPTVIPPMYSLWTLVAYHRKIYLIYSDFNPKVFDPATNLWKELPNLPHTYLRPGAVVFNDQIHVYDRDEGCTRSTKNVRWNEARECWEELEETPADLYLLHLEPFCTVDDVESIRSITKQNRHPKRQMDKTCELFSENM